jgi:hypothetical protein
VKKKKTENSVSSNGVMVPLDHRIDHLKHSMAEMAGLSNIPGAKTFANLLKDPEFEGMDIKCVAIASGLNLMELANIFKDGMLAETMLKVSEVISRKAANVVEATLDAACREDSFAVDRRLALEICGIITPDKKGGSVNINMGSNGNGSQPKNGDFVSSAKTGTKVLEIDIGKVPLEEEEPIVQPENG